MPTKRSSASSEPKRAENAQATKSESGPKKTERSHEENQERAYIAASRRQDRSIEARVQSARMASEIHKKRTGKSFRITEDIVRKEEMYEEEEDDYRRLSLLNPHMQTENPEFNARIEAWMTNRLAMSKYLQRSNEEWKDNHINRMFAQSFPLANQQAQQISQSMSMYPGYGAPNPQSPQQNAGPQSPMSPAFQAVNYDHGRHGSIGSAVSPSDAAAQNSNAISSPSPSLSMQSTPQSHQATSFDQATPEQSVFTAELPPEMRLMMGMDMDMNITPYGQNVSNYWSDNGHSGGTGRFVTGQEMTPVPNKLEEYNEPDFLLSRNDEPWQSVDELEHGFEPNWESFINEGAWASES